ncbi:PAS-domain containing protein [uncultured Sulfitobacter sp.]|uniref:PAS-domain containing protein n=1 Tax=uncultured Sulfitobacter sp. TaxID=191468 RepID=UPI0026183338|nr:PAS-domain containing protein [uncultured Sulfitobacter sp.]
MSDLVLVLAVALPTIALSVCWALRPAGKNTFVAPRHDTEILFKNGLVEHASDSALALLPIAIGSHNWQDLYDILHQSFPTFPTEPHEGPHPETTVVGDCSQFHQIRIIWRAESTSLIFERRQYAEQNASDLAELDTLRQLSVHAAHPAWKTGVSGNVTWYNAAYRKLGSRLPKGTFNPEKPIFDIPMLAEKPTTDRIRLEVTDTDVPQWFDIACTPLPDGIIFEATSLNALIKAEDAQRDFVQTLTKTFAHLSIGLAIFNRDRQLALFNPALIDLTGLSVSFLSPRPTLDSFFDALRENRRMPEPKNYSTWRHRMASLVSEAEIGKFEEVWTLETGQTYSVKGRPHPDGAIAFLIEDISAEISLTRTFRAELELGQSLADTFEDALAVFSQAGILTFSNKAYDLLWGFEFNTSFADVTIVDAIKLWKGKSSPNPLWQDLQESVMSIDDRQEWQMPVSIKGQLPMSCKIVPIASGATVVRFTRQDKPQASEAPAVNYSSNDS